MSTADTYVRAHRHQDHGARRLRTRNNGAVDFRRHPPADVAHRRRASLALRRQGLHNQRARRANPEQFAAALALVPNERNGDGLRLPSRQETRRHIE